MPSTVYLITLRSVQARDWWGENVHTEPYQRWGTWSFVIEHRYIEPIIEAMLAVGFQAGSDFDIGA